MSRKFLDPRIATLLAAISVVVLCQGVSRPVVAQITAFSQTVAETAARDADIAAFYRERAFQPFWTADDEAGRDRRAELLRALQNAASHGLPAARYDVSALIARLRAVQTSRDRALAEVEVSRLFLQYARDIQTGVLTPQRIDSRIVREISYRDRKETLAGLAASRAAPFFRALPPRSMEYNALLKEKVLMEQLLAVGGWGPRVPASALKPGDRGEAVIALRNRLIRMSYLPRSNAPTYDAPMTEAVRQFQVDHGLNADGVAGPATMAQINVNVAERLQSVLVALERERWFNTERGKRHILVNIPDFTAKIIDDGKVTFETRSVVGAARDDRPTPEFSDMMEHMVINPTWFVPRSIVTQEYLPQLRRNPNATRHLVITDRRGRQVNRNAVNFAAYSAQNFPFSMRQPPSQSNALGLVKFMFPNKYNIYLHDTPAKDLFARDARAFSHGCVRLAEPFEFAYALLAAQTDDPQGEFHRVLRTGKETKVNLETPVPVHIIYRTAVTNAHGHTEYRADVYGRDARIWRALENAGVVLGGVQG